MRLRVSLGLLVAALSSGCADRRASADPSSAPPPSQPAPVAPAPIAPAPSAPAAAALGGDGLPVDLGELRDDEKRSFYHLIDKYPSACGKAHSLKVSLQTDPKCKRSVFAARYISRLLKAHLLESEVEEHYDLRFGPSPKIDVDVSNAPLRGEPHAPVTLVEFSDFQCPHCKHLQPVLERVLDEYRGQVRLYFKQYPIERAHPDARLAAAAALAAGKQGKFWQFHDRLFGGDQENEGMPVLEKIAKDLKLDQKKWKADIETAKDQVTKDHGDGEKVDINATPTLFINGRLYRGPNTFEEIKDWIDEELNK
jgi:predicted DsbA family dithiol-disulfide isomerase